MTLQLVNPNRIYSGVFDRMGRFLIDLKSELVGSGLWEVTGSGDGDVAFANQGQTAGPSYDVLTKATPWWDAPALDQNFSDPSNKNTISRPYAWMQLKEVGSTRTLQFRRAAGLSSSYSDNFMFRFIPGGVVATGASATLAPAAVGPYFQMGGDPSQPGGTQGVFATDSALRHTQESDVIINILTATSARAQGVCPFVVLIAHAGVVRPVGGFFYESLLQSDDADPHPYILRLANGNAFEYVFGSKTQEWGPFYDAGYGACGAGCVPWAFDLYRNVAMPNGGAAMPSHSTYLAPSVGAKWRSNAPRVRVNNGNSPGVSEHFLTNYVNRNYPDTFNLGDPNPYAAAGMLLLPWKQNVAPIVGA